MTADSGGIRQESGTVATPEDPPGTGRPDPAAESAAPPAAPAAESAAPSAAPAAAESGETPADDAPAWRFWPAWAILGAAVALLSFTLWSWQLPWIGFGKFTHPPVYGDYLPIFDRLAFTVVPAAVLLAGIAWLVATSRRLSSPVALALAVGGGVVTAITVGLVRGDWQDLIRGVSTDPDAPYYTSDLHYLDEYGVRGFVERHPEMTRELHSYSSRTHPPGVHVLLYAIFKVVGAGHGLRISIVVATLGLCSAVAAWLIARTLAGERAGRIAAVLFVAAPGPLMLAFTNLDMVFALALAGSAALFVLAIHRRSVPVSAAAGAVLGLGTLMTFATSFVVLATAVAVFVQVPWRRAVQMLAAAAGGGLAVLVAAWALLGFDVLASYLSSPPAAREYNPYWIFASPAAWLIYAGLPLAALGVVGLFKKVPGAKRPVLPMVLVMVMVTWAALPTSVTKLRPGEVERTWAFLYPLVAAAAAIVVDRWTRGRRWSGAIIAGLVVLSVAQAVLIQGLWDNQY